MRLLVDGLDVSLGDMNKSTCHIGTRHARSEDHTFFFRLPLLYKGDTTMLLELISPTGEQDYTLLTTILEDDKKDRVFTRLLGYDDCPPSKPYLQWIIERAEAKRKSKLRSGGYTEDEGSVGFKKPMGLSTWDSTDDFCGPFIVQPKLNGVRCVAYPDGRLVSRGNILFRQGHITEALVAHPLDYPLDCELYCHGRPFEEISGAARRGHVDWLELHAFDYLVPGKRFDERYAKLMSVSLEPPIFLVGATVVDEVTYEMRDNIVSHGYEGLVIRLPWSLHENSRSKEDWKFKVVDEQEFPIANVRVDLSPTGRKMVKFVCKHEGKLFEVVPAWSHERRAEWLEDYHLHNKRVLHKPLTVEHRGWTKDNLPFHAVGKEVRDYE